MKSHFIFLTLNFLLIATATSGVGTRGTGAAETDSWNKTQGIGTRGSSAAQSSASDERPEDWVEVKTLQELCVRKGVMFKLSFDRYLFKNPNAFRERGNGNGFESVSIADWIATHAGGLRDKLENTTWQRANIEDLPEEADGIFFNNGNEYFMAVDDEPDLAEYGAGARTIGDTVSEGLAFYLKSQGAPFELHEIKAELSKALGENE